MSRVAVIGAGAAGLETVRTLTAAGYDVTGETLVISGGSAIH